MRSTVLRAAVGAAAIALAVAGCGSSTTGGTAAPASASAPASSSAAPEPSAPASSPAVVESPSAQTRDGLVSYADYSADPAAFSAGPVVLFFHADWCPKCRETKENLTADPASLPDGLTVVEVDFDTETGLRQKYGVTVQHTFVQVDAGGEKLSVWTGTFTGQDIASKVV